jgi:hypothetical protein
MIVCSDCESGNKTAFEIIKTKLEAGSEYLELAFFVCFARLSPCWEKYKSSIFQLVAEM